MDTEPLAHEGSGKEKPSPLSTTQILVDGMNLSIQNGDTTERFNDSELQLWRPVMQDLQTALVSHPEIEGCAAILQKMERKNDTLPFWYKQSFDIVVRELLVNSVEAIRSQPERNGTIGVSSRVDTEKKALVISIADNGQGLPTDKEKVFEEGYSSKKSKLFRETFGNGLYRSKLFVGKIMGGKLEAFDNNRDLGGQKGATFTITLPFE